MSTRQTNNGRNAKKKPKVADVPRPVQPLERASSRTLELIVTLSASVFALSLIGTFLFTGHANGFTLGTPTPADYVNAIVSALAGISFPVFLVSGVWLLIRKGHATAAKSAGALVVVLGIIAVVFIVLSAWALSGLMN